MTKLNQANGFNHIEKATNYAVVIAGLFILLILDWLKIKEEEARKSNFKYFVIIEQQGK